MERGRRWPGRVAGGVLVRAVLVGRPRALGPTGLCCYPWKEGAWLGVRLPTNGR